MITVEPHTDPTQTCCLSVMLCVLVSSCTADLQSVRDALCTVEQLFSWQAR